LSIVANAHHILALLFSDTIVWACAIQIEPSLQIESNSTHRSKILEWQFQSIRE